MLNLLAEDYVRLIVRPDGFAGQSNPGGVDERPYFVYNDVEITTGNFLSGHNPQLEIYKIN